MSKRKFSKSRRNFLRSTLVGAPALFTGCGFTQKQMESFQASCLGYDDDGMLRIDMHCHVMNARDSNTAAFTSRRVLSGNLEELGRQIIPPLLSYLDSDYDNARREANNLLNRIRKQKDKSSLEAFCRMGLPGEIDLLASNDGTHLASDRSLGDGRAVGFLTSRIRNAALLMAQFPKIDLFLPSHVDFYEGASDQYTEPARMQQLLTALAIATNGRMLPMVSFNPERYFYEVRDGHAFNNIDLIRNAVENGGAVAVKVHPSSGFDPYSNVDFGFLTQENPRGCSDRTSISNDDRARERELEFEMLEGLDKAMRKLYDCCSELDIPILTHSSTSRAARPDCMEVEPRGPSEWTNSPWHWQQALQSARQDRDSNFRVVLAHFAGGFANQEPWSKDRDSLNQFPAKDATRLIPSAWLQSAMDYIGATARSGMYLDLSIMNELAYSQAMRDRTMWDFSPGIHSRSAIADARSDGGRLAALFEQFMVDNAHLHGHVMYGSDWHMPSVLAVSGQDGYMKLIESVLPEQDEIRRKVMGQNAAEFFGLKRGRKTRERLDQFFDRHDIDPRTVHWLRKVDGDV